MGTSAMDHPLESPAETTTEAATEAASPVREVVSGIWYMGVGLVAVAGEQTGRMVKALVDKGREVQPMLREQGKKAAEEVSDAVGGVGDKLKGLTHRVAQAPEAAEAALDDKVVGALQRLGFPTRDEIAAMSAKLDSITERLESLQAARKPGKRQGNEEG